MSLFAFILILTVGCVSIQYKEHYNRYFMPYNDEKVTETQFYNCLFVKGILGDPSEVIIYLEPRKHHPPFLIVHEKMDLKNNDLYNLTKEQPIFVPYELCNQSQIFVDREKREVTTYNLNFLAAWVFDSNYKKIRLVDTDFWKILKKENDIDEIQTYLTIKDEPDGFFDVIRYIVTLSFGVKDTTKQIHLRFKPRIETLSQDRPKCKP